MSKAKENARLWAIEHEVRCDLQRWKTTTNNHPDYPNFCHPDPTWSAKDREAYYDILKSLKPARLYVPIQDAQ